MPRTSAQTYARRRLTALMTLILLLALGGLAAVLLSRSNDHGRQAAADQAQKTSGSRARTTASPKPHTPAAAFAPSLTGIPVGRWTALPPAPHSRGEVSAALAGDSIYVVGGFDTAGHTTALVERLDLRTGHWSTSRPLPPPLHHLTAVGYDGKLYVVGGYSQPSDTSAGAVHNFWRYDPVTGRWAAMPPAPLPRAAAGAAVLGNRLYVAGGRSDTLTTISGLAIFDFDTGRWSVGPSLHHAREHVAGVAADGAVWILGGRAVGVGNFADVERYTPGAPSWERLAPMPVARSGFQAVDVGGKIVVVGGEGPAGTIGEVDELDPATGHWTRLPDLPTARHGLGLVAVGPLVYAIEGGPQPGLTTSSVVERLRLR
ncbi:MAG: Kelch repeat-containing protein [Solirubrobacteraceae bacterium]